MDPPCIPKNTHIAIMWFCLPKDYGYTPSSDPTKLGPLAAARACGSAAAVWFRKWLETIRKTMCKSPAKSCFLGGVFH